MKNLWRQMDPPYATWIADFSAIADRPTAIQRFVEVTLAAGERHRIFEVLEATDIGYLRSRDGALSEVLQRNFERDAVLDLFGFTAAAMLPGIPGSSTVQTTLSHYDRDGQLVESAVIDVGVLLTSLTPNPDMTPNGCSEHYPALRAVGRRYFDARTHIGVKQPAAQFEVAATFGIHADIWFPWIFGAANPNADLRRMFDNRELAMRHTPRLNAFLAEAAEAARSAGGSFGVWRDETLVPVLDWVTDDSVRLDWDPPDGVMPPELHDVEWDW